MAEPVDINTRRPYILPQPPDGGDGNDLEARVSKLEADLSDIKVTLGRIDERLIGMSQNLASKADVAKVEGLLASKVDYKWFGAFIIGLTLLVMREEIISLFQRAAGTVS